MSRKEAKSTEQEASLLARLHHPNIVTFWEAFNDSSRGRSNLYIVMDFADGGDLSNLIKNRRHRLMAESQVVNITVQVSLALKHVHDRKILHRDLKCANIFLTSNGIVKLGDFGIAKVLRNTGELASTQIGTPYFMSPEILASKRYNNKTDIWSLGCVVFELMCLKVPFEGSSMKQLVTNIINKPTPQLPTQYSTELKALVNAMLAKNFRERPSVNTILSKPIMRERITNILDDHVRQREFSHTVLHGDDILTADPSVQPSSRPHAIAPHSQVSASPVPVPPPRPPIAPAAMQAAAPAGLDPRIAAARQKQIEANAVALAQAKARQARHERDKARALEALDIARQRRAEREKRDKLEAQSRDAAAKVEREEMERKIAAQMEHMKLLKAERQHSDKELLRMKQAAEEREAFARQKAREARDKPWRENARDGGVHGVVGADVKKNEPPVSFLVLGEKEPVRVAQNRSPAVGASPPSEENSRMRPRMKPSVPRQQPANYKAPQPIKQNSPPDVSPRPRLGVLERHAQAQNRDAAGVGVIGKNMRVEGRDLKGDQVKVAEVAGGPSAVPVVAVPGGGGAKVDMSAAQERRRKFELLKAQGALRQAERGRDKGRVDESVASRHGSIADEQTEAEAIEVAALDDGRESSTSSDEEDIATKANSSKDSNTRENDIGRRRGFNVDRLKNFEQQMGVLQNIISDLSPSSYSPPSAFAVGNGQKPLERAGAGAAEKAKGIAVQKKDSVADAPVKNKAPSSSPPPSKDPVAAAEDLLAQRRKRRNDERKNLRDFVAAQRKAQGFPARSPSCEDDSSYSASPADSATPSPPLPPRYPSSSSISPSDSSSPSPHAAARGARPRADRVSASNLRDDFSLESKARNPQINVPKPSQQPKSKAKVNVGAKVGGSKPSSAPTKAHPMSAEELRQKRDAERMDLRRLISEKREHKAELMRLRAKEREENYVRRAQEADEADLVRASAEWAGGRGTDADKDASKRNFIIYGGGPEISDDVESISRDDNNDVVAFDDSIGGEDSMNLYDVAESTSGDNGSGIPSYISADVLKAQIDSLPPPVSVQSSPTKKTSQSTAGDQKRPELSAGRERQEENEEGGMEVRFRDFLGRDYTPLSTQESGGICNAPQSILHTPSNPKPSSDDTSKHVRYSQDDINVDRKRETPSRFEKQASSSCCFRIPGLFSSPRDGVLDASGKRESSKRRSGSSVSPAPADEDSAEDESEEHNYANDDANDKEIDADVNRSIVELDGSGDEELEPEPEEENFPLSRDEFEEEYGSMLLAMEDALCLPDKHLMVNEDGVEEDDDVFEDEEDIDDEDGMEDGAVELTTGSSWGDGGDNSGDTMSEEVVSEALVGNVGVSSGKGGGTGGKKSPTPLYAYAALQGKLSPSVARHRVVDGYTDGGDADRHSALDDEGVMIAAANGDDIIRLAEDMLTRNIRELERHDSPSEGTRAGLVEAVEDSSMTSSWASGSGAEAEDPLEEGEEGDELQKTIALGQKNMMTIYGVPFPLGQTARHEVGMQVEDEDSAAVKMEALREYLEDSLGLDRFTKAYRLLKSIGPRDDDDSLLNNMEEIVGVEGLEYMDAFIQLITIEDRFEST